VEPQEQKGDILFSLASRPLTEVDGFVPRTARASVGDLCYHVINRGNAQTEVFHKAGDYQVFVELISFACGEKKRVRSHY
jgi:hypothetical protein